MEFPDRATISNAWRFRPSERRVVLVVGDLFLSLVALLIGLYFWGIGDLWLGFSAEFLRTRVPEWFYFMPAIWIILILELYDMHRATNWRDTIRGIITATVLGFGLYLLLFFVVADQPRALLPRRGVAGFIISVSLLTLGWRYIFIRIMARDAFMRRFLVVGAGRPGRGILQVLSHLDPPPFQVVGVIDDDPQKKGSTIENYPVLGGSENLVEIAKTKKVSDIIVAILGEVYGQMFQALLDAQEMGVELINMPAVYEELLNRLPIQHLDAVWLLRSFGEEARVNIFYRMGKRLMDFLGGLIGTIFFLAVMPFVSAAILIDNGRPIFYRQTRLGRGGKPYEIIKFRTMRQDAEADGQAKWAEEKDQRVTRLGYFLRRTHLDEVPQFMQVLSGEMSLVGPRSERPEIVEALQKNIPFYRARLLVKPGITGWAQLNYGYVATVKDTQVKLEYDLYYIKHRSLWLDILILLRTPWTMLGFRGR